MQWTSRQPYLKKTLNISDVKAQSEYVRDNILKDMEILRKSADETEVLTDAEYWPFPAYDELLFGVR